MFLVHCLSAPPTPTPQRLHALGGEVADSSQKVTHLVAGKVTRTVKFLTAMSVVKHIVSPEWLEESWRSQKFADEQSYTLRDAEAEVLFAFSLEESLKRAHSAPLFKVRLTHTHTHVQSDTAGLSGALARWKE